MEDAGGQVITPIASCQNLVGRFYPASKKRGVSVHASNVACRDNSETWNANSWSWDPARFVAKPLQGNEVTEAGGQSILRRNEDQSNDLNPRMIRSMGEDKEKLFLKLESGEISTKSGSSGEIDSEELQQASKPAKRVRAGSPGGTSYPVCQVDGCKENLSAAKDYHRRHKVCGIHSKASEAIVGRQTQRFCQQCSRFHLLAEFDAGKRSCRRRLAGHNRRRRKTHSEDTAPQLLAPQNRDKNISDVNVVNLLAMLSQAQRNNADMSRSFPNNDQLVQIIGNMNSSLPEMLAPKLKGSVSKHASNENQNSTVKEITSLPATRNLLAALTATSPAPHTHDIQSDQTSTEGSESEKSKSSCINEEAHLNLQSGVTKGFHFVAPTSRNISSSPMGDVELNVIEKYPNLPLQLFNSSHDDHQSRKGQSGWNMLSSQSNNPSQGAQLFSSRPIVHDFFALENSSEKIKDGNLPEVDLPSVRGNASNFCSTSLQLFGGPSLHGENGSFQESHDQMEKASTSGSFYSNAPLKPDPQNHTGRIIFKLFDKDPSHLPGSLRTQINNWLSNSPSDMESYIRPGCIVLSLYISMSTIEWDKLEENLLSYLKSLVDVIDAQFWGTGRFLVQTNRQMAISNDGRIRLCKSWRSQGVPQLISVSPLAVVGTQETSILLKGRRLLGSSTKIHCTHAVEYCTEKHTSSCQDSIYDEIMLGSFKFEDAAANRLGRCFIEVENGSKGASFPIIIADKAICEELKFLETEIDCSVEDVDDIPTYLACNEVRSDSRERALHFLNELGWFFQRKQNYSLSAFPDYSLTRLKFLLIFSIERDFCAVVKALLDILVEMNLCQEGLVRDSLGMLSDIHLLNRAVRRRCQGMVNMLIHYSVIDPTDNSKKYLFPCDEAGPGGITPLHLAASLPNSVSIIDALTSDPLEVGLRSWSSVLDEQGLSPFEYAAMRNLHSYNSLVAQKLADRSNDQISIPIDNAEQLSMETDSHKKNPSTLKPSSLSCSKCTAVLALGYGRRTRGSRALLHRSYIHSILVVAAVCVCVCLLLRGHAFVGCSPPFAWDTLKYGAF